MVSLTKKQTKQPLNQPYDLLHFKEKKRVLLSYVADPKGPIQSFI